MLTDKQLEFVLGEIQGVQKKNFGGKNSITVMTGCGTTEFTVTIEYGYEKIKNSNEYVAKEKTFNFVKTLTEDQCVDYMQDIEKLFTNGI